VKKGCYLRALRTKSWNPFTRFKMLYFRPLKTVQHDINDASACFWYFYFFPICCFSNRVVLVYSSINSVQSFLGYVSCFLICLLTAYLWYAGFITFDPLSKFHFTFNLFSGFGHTHFLFTLGSYAAFHGMALRCHMNTSAGVSKSNCFKIQNFTSLC
jgi:hypothetical protein